MIVLAAGRGSRLGVLGDVVPKWLLEVGGRTLADRHLAGIALAAEAVASVRVVTGHASAAIDTLLATRPEPVGTVLNPEWAERNNWWSLLRALRELPVGDPVAVVNSDLLAAPHHVASFLREAADGPSDGLLAVDLEKELTPESMKVQRAADGTLRRIGKIGVHQPVGEYVGLLMARGPVLAALRTTLEAFVERPESRDEWYEGAVGSTAAEGQPWQIWAMPAGGWIEIDDDADLVLAHALVAAASA